MIRGIGRNLRRGKGLRAQARIDFPSEFQGVRVFLNNDCDLLGIFNKLPSQIVQYSSLLPRR
jgi:hypothetical protein